MTKKQQIQIFEDKKVRTVWDDQEETWYISIVDVCAVLTDSDYQTARKYWKVLKGRLKKEGNETVTNCYQLKMLAPDGKMRLTDVADTEQLFRLIQSVPSKKAEPFKQWMAEVASQRLDQMADPVFFLCSYVVESFWEIGYLSEYIHDLLDDEKNYRYYDVIRLRQMAYDAAKEGRLTKKDVNGTQWKTAIKELELEKGAIEHFWD